MLFDGKKRIPIGYEDFREIIDQEFYYVDKTMLIYELLTSGGKNSLITRPRRFGKTLNFSMLRYFFDITEKENQYLFDGLKISKYYEKVAKYRNTHPVVTLSLKCAKQGNYEAALDNLCDEIKGQFKRYRYILSSDKVDEQDKNEFRLVIGSKPDEALFGRSIKLLCSCLKQYYGVNTIVLIDEYDVPLEDAYFSGYYDKMVLFIRSLFESALKTNPALEFSVITGCLRISKESIFTGLNNLRVNSIMSGRFSEHFGFSESEVKAMLGYYDLGEKFETAKKWYDGYMFGKSEVYNPWSIITYVDALRSDPDALPEASWANTSSNNIIRELVSKADDSAKAIIERLIHGGSVETDIKETVTYGDLTNGNENIWSFLLFTGYLKVKELVWSDEDTGEPPVYSLVIPNIEVRSCYKQIIIEYFNTYKSAVNRDELYKALLAGDAEGFAGIITELLKKSISYYDNAEQFYHGLIAGLLANNIYYKMVSNRETGTGRSDLILYQKDRFINAVIIEFKVCGKNEAIDDAARRALKQIDERDYAAEAREQGYRNIIKYGIAFKDKVCFAVTG